MTLAEYLDGRNRALDLRAHWAARGYHYGPARALWVARVCPRSIFDCHVPPRDVRPLRLP